MSTLFWLSFFFSSPPHTCSTSGTPLLEIREGSETSSAVTTKKIYSSGGWTLKSASATAQGCFSKKEIRSIRQALQHAHWKVTQSPIACFAYDPNFTEYLLHGRLRYTHRMCSGKTADFETMEAIELAQNDLLEEMPPPPPPPPAAHPAPTNPDVTILPAIPVADPPVVAPPRPVKPPVAAVPPIFAPPPAPPSSPVRPPLTACRAVGVPLFEIRHRSDIKDTTSTIAIYSTGAWTFQPIDKDGKAGALTTGCFDKPTLTAIRDSVDHAPWDVTRAHFVCRAYSASFTDYYVHGKLEYTARLCNGQRLDDTSAAVIKKIETQMSTLLPKQDSVSVRDHREPAPVVVRDHRNEPAPMPAPVVVRDHRTVL